MHTLEQHLRAESYALLHDISLWLDSQANEIKYSPSQPRVPSGDPRGGQWTRDGGGSGGLVEENPGDGMQTPPYIPEPPRHVSDIEAIYTMIASVVEILRLAGVNLPPLPALPVITPQPISETGEPRAPRISGGGGSQVSPLQALTTALGLAYQGLVDAIGPVVDGLTELFGVSSAMAAENPTNSWGNPKTLEGHVTKHGADFGANNANEYARQANEFYKRGQTGQVQRIVDKNGIVRIYDPKTNTFGSYNANGSTRTFFKPPEGQAYFDRQILQYAKPGLISNPSVTGGPESPPGSGSRLNPPLYSGGGGGGGSGKVPIKPGSEPINH